MSWDNIISRGVWVILQPSNFLLIVLFISFFLLHFKKYSSQILKRLVWLSIILIMFASFTTLGQWLMYPLENRFRTNINQTNNGPYSGIIVLAGSERSGISTIVNQPTVSDAGERISSAIYLARKLPDLPVIHTGGTRKLKNGWSENDVARHLFQQGGIDIARIRFDGKSYNTSSNAIESKKLINENEKAPWLLVTSAYHMPRAVGAFQNEKINITPYPVDFRSRFEANSFIYFNAGGNLALFDLAIHEYIGLIAYYVTGRSSSLFP